MKRFFYLFALVFVIQSCATEKTVKYTIASQKADCEGVAPQKCLLIKQGNDSTWSFFYSNIEGFNYEEGYEYVIDVKEEKLENVPADASSIKYILVKEISKEAKTSENMPAPKAKRYECVGKVLSVASENIGKGGAEGKVSASVVEIEVTSSEFAEAEQGKTIFCELISTPNVMPEVGREYVFQAKYLHPAHAKGVYLLETNVLDLTK